MKILPKLRIKYGEAVGNDIYVEFPDLRDYPASYLEADSLSGSGTLSANGLDFSISQYIVIGTPGTPKCELIKIHGSTSPTATVITLASNTSYNHARGEMVRFIPYNQIVVERSTDSGATWTPLTAVALRSDAVETYFQRVDDATTDEYRVRFKNETSSKYSAYSGDYAGTGVSANTRGAIKRRALNELGEKIGPLINDEFLNEALDEARREVDSAPEMRRYPFRTRFNTNVASIVPGSWSISAPTDLRDRNTPDNILAIRIGAVKGPLVYQDQNRFSQNYQNVSHTTVATTFTGGGASLVLTSSGDFDELGSIYVGAESISQGVDDGTYTANNESTNTLSGLTGVANNHAVGTDVWQNITFGCPTAYTIHSGRIYFNMPFPDDLAAENIYMDYYSKMSALTDDTTELDEPQYDMYVDFLKWKIKSRKSKGTLQQKDDPDFVAWADKKAKFVGTQIGGQRGYFIPN